MTRAGYVLAGFGAARSTGSLCPAGRRLLIEACAVAPREIDTLAAGVREWPSLLRAAEKHRLLPLLASVLAQTTVPGPVGDHLREARDAAADRRSAQWLIWSEVIGAFAKRGIDVMLLKGVSIAERAYVSPSLRTASDLDLLVRRPDVDGAAELLRELGYLPYAESFYREHHFHVLWIHGRRKFDDVVELHWDVTKPHHCIRFEPDRWWSACQRVETSIGECVVPPREDELAYLAWHCLASGAPSLRDLADFDRLRAHHGPELSMKKVRERARAAGAGGFLEKTLELTGSLWTPRDEAPTREALDRTRSWLNRNLLSPATLLRTDSEPWWPLKTVAAWSLLPRDRAPWRTLFAPEMGGHDGRPPWLADKDAGGSWTRRTAALLLAIGLAALPAWGPPAVND